MDPSPKPFTFDEYRKLICLARQHYRFIAYDCTGSEKTEGRTVYWRHDIDISIDQALDLARIEREEGVFSTFFVHLHARFYHIWEKETAHALRRIVSLGHRIGLHFDCHYYDTSDAATLEPALLEERAFLERLVAQPVAVCSLHNPTQEMLDTWTEDRIAGMVNTYSAYFRNSVDYVSDSNGIWRYRSLRDVLAQHERPRLQVLTHPVWWTKTVSSPEEKMLSAIANRARTTEKIYRSEARVVISQKPEPAEVTAI